MPRELPALEPETKFFDSSTGPDYNNLVMPDVRRHECSTAVDKVVSAGDRTFVVAGSAKYKCGKKVTIYNRSKSTIDWVVCTTPPVIP